MITNDAGQVAIAYYQPSQAFVGGNRVPSGKDYVFVTRYKGVCMSWVDPGDVEAILSMRGGCCGSRKQLFNYATDGQVALWTTGGRGGNGNSDCGCH